MKNLSIFFVVLACSSAYASDGIGSCSILPPDKGDSNKMGCSDNHYGITYKGVLAMDTCYSSYEAAKEKMKNLKFCKKPMKHQNCKILLPGKSAKNGLSCGAKFGLTYKGHIYSKTPCLDTLENAFEKMESLAACEMEDQINDFRIMYPNEEDKNGYSCNNHSFAVTRKGYVTGQYCFPDIDWAIKEMKRLSEI